MAHVIIWNSCEPSVGFEDPPTTALRPVGPHQLASWLGKFGYTVQVIDFCHLLTPEQLVKITEHFISHDTVAIGASATFWISNPTPYVEPAWAVSTRSALEPKYPNVKWILGSGAPIRSKFFRFRWTKFYSYCENNILSFLDAQRNISTPRPAFSIVSLDEQYCDSAKIAAHEVIPFQFSRGCQFKCSFCSYPLIGKKKNSYIRSYDAVEREFIHNYERFGTTRYYFVDDTFNESEEKVSALAEIATRLPFQLEWIGYLRLDLIAARPHSIELLKQSGLKSAFFGIESFNAEASLAVGKGWNGKHAKDFLLRLRDNWKDQITWSLSLIVGLPGEDKASIDETQKWCINNEMYHWIWSPLTMSCDSDIEAKSAFERDSAKFGYAFPNKNDAFHWQNEQWDASSASVKANELRKEKLPHQRFASWRLGEIASTFDAPFDSLLDTKVTDVDQREVKRLVEKQVQAYAQSLCNESI